MKFKKIKNYLKRNKLFVLLWLKFLRYKRIICIKYFYMYTLKNDFRQRVGYELNLEDPKTFNEKIQWLKINYRDTMMPFCADKVAVRDYISEKIGENYLVSLHGIYKNIDEIDFDNLPNAFVLKSNHASEQIIICKNKKDLDCNNTIAEMKNWLDTNYYYSGGEWVYKNISPLIICEELLVGEIIDYKFMCFNGKPKLMFTCSERNKSLKVTFFDMEFNKMPFIRKYPCADNIKKPENFNKMKELSEILSKRFPFVRVDFYENNGKIYFGELTFFPGNGMEWFEPVEWDRKLGDMLELSKVNKEFIK
ncbi:MAG: glycosyl transferase [Acholeplasmataceae bacterium]|nr:glycosyl transferase [Acholeplasmataceae bacterium]